MCLGIPGKILDVYQANSLPMGRVDYGGIIKEVCLAYVPEAQPGEYVIVHVGFAISRLDEAEALATLEVLNEVGDVARELGLNTA
ncbi:MAG: HypC/HybG/HupF family hydrogenase formation chaperone [Anaerolineales bacterium]